MVYVLKVDTNGYYRGEGYFVEEPNECEIITPITVGYIKPKWTGTEWIEGATEEEIQEWKNNQKEEPYVPGLKERNRADIDYLAIMLGVDLSV